MGIELCQETVKEEKRDSQSKGFSSFSLSFSFSLSLLSFLDVSGMAAFFRVSLFLKMVLFCPQWSPLFEFLNSLLGSCSHTSGLERILGGGKKTERKTV
ncbi:hypothetical protein CEXT_702561 [Caerostris extrusa]|uniref:Uncharacterized protein n=1 Tax=Caerostris extrusa TaxID=172846 RepID=A0AAV4TDU1_CAEEX|nr:hypothetical protein CEXT_702561 [Caerostris extrusa]